MVNAIYFLPGRNGKLSEMPGGILRECCDRVFGRDLTEPFISARFSEQVSRIGEDLLELAAGDDTALVGRSYGGYLLMHALLKTGLAGKDVLLLSPVLGAAMTEWNGGFYGVIPPGAERLRRSVDEHRFPVPRRIIIHTGELDRGCDPQLAAFFASRIDNATLHILPDTGHTLEEHHYRTAVVEFLGHS